MEAKKGDWVEIENVILEPEERAGHLPEDTRKTALKMWVRGFLETSNAKMGQNVKIITLAERKINGKLVEINPRYTHNYGDTIVELIQLGEELKKELLQVLKGGSNQ